VVLRSVEESDGALVLCCAQIINHLRFGCTPVGVLDGEAPEEKLETLQARSVDALFADHPIDGLQAFVR
jgi:hypothetical protein